MLALADLQTAIRAVVLGGDPAALAGTIPDDGIGHAGRLRVYRNNTTVLLIDALADTFPVVRRLVGEDFFAQAARLYVRAFPPESPCLSEYGDIFPDFIETHEPAAGIPYLADVARLEWAINESYYAADAPILSPAALRAALPDGIDRLGLKAHPSLRIVASPFPVDRIWAVNQDGADPDAAVDLASGGVRLAVARPDSGPRFQVLSPGGLAFLRAAMEGASLEQAAKAGESVAARFDAAAALAALTAAGAFSEVFRCNP